ncbi:RNA recognition motif domain-containing protein [Acidobacteriota bacterium]
MKLYVGNISYTTDEQRLREEFEKFGDVEEVTVVTDRETGRSRGFGFVVMPNDEHAKAAVAGLNSTEMDGRTIKVNEARPARHGDRPKRRSRW